MFERVRRDLLRYYAFESRTGTPGLLEKAKIVATGHALKALMVHRFGAWLHRSELPTPVRVPLKVAHRAMAEVVRLTWGMEIHSAADIDGGLYISHPYGVLIGAVHMGRDCNVSHYVTIGVRPGGATVEEQVPTIGERVFFGPGSVVYGKITIGSGASVGPVTVVGRNLPPNCFASGNPMQIVQKKFDNHAIIYGTRPPP